MIHCRSRFCGTLISSLFLALVGCGKDSTSSVPTGVTPTTTGAGTTTTTGGTISGGTDSLPATGRMTSGPSCALVSTTKPTAAFAVRVYSQWPGATTWNRLDTGTCETNVVSAADVACTITVPEAQLYYSRLYFEAFALNGSSQCDVIYFSPYSYLADGLSATAALGWNSGTVDCSKPYDQKDCWNGAAKKLVEGFPRSRAFFHTIKDLSYPAWCSGTMVESGYFGQNGYFSNRWMTNDLAAGLRAGNRTPLGSGDAYIANSMIDWRWKCVNNQDDVQYSIKLEITDSNGGPDTIPSWTGATF